MTGFEPNMGPLASEATTMSTESQPLPINIVSMIVIAKNGHKSVPRSRYLKERESNTGVCLF